MALVTQPSAAPVRKIKAVIASGVITSVIVAIGLALGISIPPESVDTVVIAGTALVAAIQALAGYFTKAEA